MADPYIKVGADMVWPHPVTDLGWKLRYAAATLTRSEQLTLASIVDAYTDLVMNKTGDQRAFVVRELRKVARSSTRSQPK